MPNKEKQINRNKSKLMFSIIIPVRTINDYLRENITHLKQLKHKSFEVIILTDEKEEFDFGEKKSLFRIIPTGKLGPGEKRNIGAQHAQGEILAFLDDDAYPSDDWLTNSELAFKEHNTYALGAPAMTPPNVGILEQASGWVLQSWLASGNTTFRHTPQEARQIDDFPTVNMLVKKENFDKVGGFLTEFWPGEDTKLCLDLVLAFGMFWYDPRPVVYHHRRNLFLPHLKQVSRYGRHRGQFAKIYPETSRQLSYFIPSLFLLGLVFGPLVISIFWFLAPIYPLALISYLGLLGYAANAVFSKTQNLDLALLTVAGIFTTHMVYGYNFMLGYFIKPELKLRDVDTKSKNYVGG